MAGGLDRRTFVHGAAACGAAAICGGAGTAAELPTVAPHSLTVIAGKPRERGRQYARAFHDAIHAFLEKEIYAPFTHSGSATTREAMLRYAAACAIRAREFSPVIMEEMEGMAEGTGLRLEELVLMTLHEELYHKGVLPAEPHCTAIAAGPPETGDGHTYVGQTWDWMASVYGLSQMLLWKRPEGPDLLSYAYPGLWVGAAMNSAGLAFGWTSAFTEGIPGPRVGIPSYILIAHLLYQESLAAALEEARRARHAGWFTIVLGDANGRLANVEGSPRELAVETGKGLMARVSYGSRRMTGTPDGKPVAYRGRCAHMWNLLRTAKGTLDGPALQGCLANHGAPSDPATAVCVHGRTLDAILFDTSAREAWVTRGPACSGKWQRFAFADA